MINLILFAIGVIIIVNVVKRRRRRSAPKRAAPRPVRTVTAPKRAAPRLPDLETERRKQFRRAQAAADIVHLTQVKRDLLTAYEKSGCMDGCTEQAYKKRIAYDVRLRNVEKQIERAAYIANS